ncbi:hypothetical protein [Haloprofundus salinisoli]|uniref:hypothetical protein n=1 Tax=Haloprofundus salinisoli TaxID=2876193 RepID=UPI001CCFF089|nr:hypothetical protein [Haloprofundus salinisoli]
MEISEGTVVIGNNMFFPEIILEQISVDDWFTKLNKAVLDGSRYDPYDELPEEINRTNILGIGDIDGYWQFWDNCKPNEVEFSSKNLRPLYINPEFKVEISNSLIDKYGIEDYKSECEIVYYAFGLFSIRLKLYYRVSETLSTTEYIKFINDIPYEVSVTGNSIESSVDPFSYIRGTLIDELIIGGKNHHDDTPSYSDLFFISYVYSGENVDDPAVSKVVSGQPKDLAEHIQDEITNSNFGLLADDKLVITDRGAFIYTPEFSDNHIQQRRRKRLQILNNILVALDVSKYEQNSMFSIQRKFREIQASLTNRPNRKTLIGHPIEHWQLAVLDDSLLLADNLEELRGKACRTLVPENRDHIKERIAEMANWMIEHDSELKKAISKIGGSMFSKFLMSLIYHK